MLLAACLCQEDLSGEGLRHEVPEDTERQRQPHGPKDDQHHGGISKNPGRQTTRMHSVVAGDDVLVVFHLSAAAAFGTIQLGWAIADRVEGVIGCLDNCGRCSPAYASLGRPLGRASRTGEALRPLDLLATNLLEWRIGDFRIGVGVEGLHHRRHRLHGGLHGLVQKPILRCAGPLRQGQAMLPSRVAIQSLFTAIALNALLSHSDGADIVHW
mmetsp:Transcript_69823/g.149449  ORF Transcript_69823/g.149449 Transcript_69823/m.149449 type:complete len:213 (+) Transcript_69823:1308-1946(+)